MTKIKTIPNTIGQLTSLTELYLGNALTELPENITLLENLITLNVRDNKLTTLPTNMEKLKKLKNLYIYSTLIPKSELEKLKKKMPNCNIAY